jgi:hypothetical protein
LTIGTLSGAALAAEAAEAGAGTGSRSGGLEHAASNPRIDADTPCRALRRFDKPRRRFDMWVILLEAIGALLLLALIVWWTMFHGRKRGERDLD